MKIKKLSEQMADKKERGFALTKKGRALAEAIWANAQAKNGYKNREEMWAAQKTMVDSILNTPGRTPNICEESGRNCLTEQESNAVASIILGLGEAS